MNILVANHKLDKTGGSQTFTYTLVGELVKRGYAVEYFTHKHGLISSKIQDDFGVGFMSQSSYDLILANHHTTVESLYGKGKIIQTCHGVFAGLERPSPLADGYVAISQEVQDYLMRCGFQSRIIYNGIDCNRFSPQKPLRKDNIRVLSLCHSEEAHALVEQACKLANAEFGRLDKYQDNQWDVPAIINQYDLVFGLGRSAYESLACGRPVIIYDSRSYFTSAGDGYFLEVLPASLQNNCSGRALKRNFTVDGIADQIRKYRPEDGAIARGYALSCFNIEKAVDSYLEYANSLESIKKMAKISSSPCRFLLPSRVVKTFYRNVKRRITKGNAI